MFPFVRLVVFGFSAQLLASAAPQTQTNAFYQAPGTGRMAEILEEWGREFDGRTPLNNREKLKQFQQDLPQVRDPGRRVAMQYEIAFEHLNMGDPEAALTAITNLHRDARTARFRISSGERREIRLLEGFAYLRLGELENCVQHHNPDSCLLPIRGSGTHSQRRGSENAEAIFLELARQKTNDLGARWLLNIASMTLGKYPEGVPADVRIPPSVFESEAPFPKFPELATAVGIGENALSGGTIADDFDGDGLLDIMLSKWDTLGQCGLYRNLGNGRFADITRQAGLIGVTGGLNIMQVDYNNDGWLDVYVVR